MKGNMWQSKNPDKMVTNYNLIVLILLLFSAKIISVMVERAKTYTGKESTPRVVLDLGVGAYPWPPQPTMLQSSDGRELPRHFNGNRVYIGMDMPEDPNRYWVHFFADEEPKKLPTEDEKKAVTQNLALTQKHFRSLRPEEKLSFMSADGHHIPLRNASVDEVYLCDVLGSQLVNQSANQIMKEVARVIKNSGQVVIRENVTPQWSNVKSLPGDLASFGLEVRECKKYGSSSFDELVNIYGQTFQVTEDDILAEDRYFLIAAPTNTNTS